MRDTRPRSDRHVGAGARTLPDLGDRCRDACGHRRPAARRGILGVLIREAKSLRMHDLRTIHARSASARHHPLMRTFLGVPILLRGVAYGNVYLTEKEGGATHRGGRGASAAAGGAGGCRDRECSPPRDVDPLAASARVTQRDRRRARLGARARAATRSSRGDSRSFVDARLVLIALPDGAGASVSPPPRVRMALRPEQLNKMIIS